MQSMQYHPGYSSFARQPRPRFCLFRPDGGCAPLIPLDELPAWLQVGNWSPDMYMGLQPVTLSFIPREGEYDVICSHCSSTVDSTHQSTSERNEGSQSPNSAVSQTRSCPAALCSPATELDASSTGAAIPMGFPMPMPGQPPFTASLQFPFIGFYGLNMPVMAPQSFGPFTAPQKTSTSVASCASSPNHAPPEPTTSLEQIPAVQPESPAIPVNSICSADHPDLNLDCPEPPDVRDRIIEATTSTAGLSDQMKVAAAIATSLCSMAEGSVASEISLTAAVEQLKRSLSKKYSLARKNSLRNRKKSDMKSSKGKVSGSRSPGSNQCEQKWPIVDPKDWDIDWPDETKDYGLEIERAMSKSNSLHSSSRVHKVHSAVRRHAKFHRRRRRADKPKDANLLIPIDGIDEAMLAEKEPKSEQPNSYTKRRERRERLADRLVHGNKDADPKSRYWHMMAPNRHDNMRHK
ncbi:hypothetical protein N7528_008063 [Penicillium herquei]|nr:hypothetical protein N7528_008063 [Penicillium herquei]